MAKAKAAKSESEQTNSFLEQVKDALQQKCGRPYFDVKDTRDNGTTTTISHYNYGGGTVLLEERLLQGNQMWFDLYVSMTSLGVNDVLNQIEALGQKVV